MSIAHQFLLAFTAYIALMNPLAMAPAFAAMMGGCDAATERRAARRALAVAFGIVLLFSTAGKVIFEIFGITLPALRTAGGMLLFIIGYQMLQGQPSRVQYPLAGEQGGTGSDALSMAVTPLGTPMLAGPGTIATAANISASADFSGAAISVGAYALLCLITYPCLVWGKALVRRMGESAMGVITRLMGLTVSVVGVQMALAGIKEAFKL